MSNKSCFWFFISNIVICIGWIAVFLVIGDLSLMVRILFTLLWIGIAIFVFIYIGYPILCEIKSDKVVERIDKFENLEKQINDLRNFCFANDKHLDQLREFLLWRQYLIDTNFMGKLKNAKLKKESVDSFGSNSYMTAKEIFKHFKEQTISFENVHRPTILLNYIGKLLELEDKQKELDKYVDKPKRATSAKSSSNIKSTNKKGEKRQ